jgi:hypothetical protein
MNDDMVSPQSLSIEQSRRARITAISGAVQRRPIVLVLGMHRSGTSLCSHILSALGVDIASEIGVDLGNDRGHWERWEIVEFHDRILGLFKRDYWGRFHDFALPVGWWADPRVAQIKREIIAFLQQRMGETYFGFKDPRTVRLMPVWHQIFNELKLAPRVVLCLRNPAQVARSLYARDGLDPTHGEYRWLVHMIDFYRYTRNLDYCAVEYEEWFNNSATNIEKLRKFLNLPWQQSESDLALLLSDLVDPDARHDDHGHREASQPLVRALYRLARQADTAAHDEIAYIVSQFVSFQQLQKPLLQSFEDVAKTAAKYPEIEQEATALRALVGERDSGIDAAELRANSAEASLAEALVEIEGQGAQIAELAKEREARAEIEREARAEIEREARAEIEREARAEIEREANELKTTLAEREVALRHAERQAQEHAAGALAMQSEIALLRDDLARAERAEQARAAAAVTLEAGIAALRGRLAQTKREAQECGAAAEAMRAENAMLQNTLAAAQQVGKAAIAAFRSSSAAAMEPDRPLGWRRAMIRFFGARTRF